MDILLIAATEAEIAPSIEYIASSWTHPGGDIYEKNGNRLQVCIGGVGMIAATYHLTKTLSKRRFDLAIQAGICGAFDRSIAIGDVVRVTSERYGDMGAEDGDDHLDIFDMGLIRADEFPYAKGSMAGAVPAVPFFDNLQQVSGLTVNMVTGNENTVMRLAETYGAQVESMEGAAFHYVCLQEQVPFVQLRAISNYIERRNRANWRIGDAILNLNDTLVSFFSQL